MSNVVRAESPIRRAGAVIVTSARVSELSFFERFELARPYIGYALLVAAIVLALRLVLRLYARYRHENVPPVTRAPMDRASLRRVALTSPVSTS